MRGRAEGWASALPLVVDNVAAADFCMSEPKVFCGGGEGQSGRG